MKHCDGCERDLPEKDFNFACRRTGKRHSRCRDCRREYSRAHYRANQVQYAAYRYANCSKYRALNRQRVLESLAQKACVDCGEQDPVVLEFDHVHGQKLYNVSVLVNSAVSWRKVLTEIQKCVVRCANCHRRKTARDFKWFKTEFGA